jgi:Acetyltransferase (GNAT) family.
MLQKEDYNFGYEWTHNGRVMHVDHLWIASEHRGKGCGSFLIETLVRVAYYEGADMIEVSIGGGEATEQFLKDNGFRVFNRRPYSGDWASEVEGEYGVDAVRKL